jgi:hypothetical protein
MRELGSDHISDDGLSPGLIRTSAPARRRRSAESFDPLCGRSERSNSACCFALPVSAQALAGSNSVATISAGHTRRAVNLELLDTGVSAHCYANVCFNAGAHARVPVAKASTASLHRIIVPIHGPIRMMLAMA